MNTLSEKSFVVAVITLLGSAVCYSQDIALDFQQALEVVPKHPKWPNGIMFYDIQDAVDSLISKHSGAGAVAFLETQVEDQNSRKRKLALLALAKLAATSQAAEKALCRQVDAPRWTIRRDAVIAVAYLDRKDGRRIAETLLAQPGPQDARRLTILCEVAALRSTS